MPILFEGKFKFLTIQAFFAFLFFGWEPLDMEKLINFDFSFVAEGYLECRWHVVLTQVRNR